MKEGAVLSKKHRTLSKKVGDILDKINPKLEDYLRKDTGFLDEVMDYSNGYTSLKEIKETINNALKELNKLKCRTFFKNEKQ